MSKMVNEKTAHIQQILKEIQEVCDKHGVYLLGTCETEGVYGEITIGNRGESCGWRDPEKLSKYLYPNGYGSYTVDRIGDTE